MRISKTLLMRTIRIILVILFMLPCAVGVHAAELGDKNSNFDPKRFEAEMEQYIVTNACLTPFEAEKFFPVYRDMHKKMRVLFRQMKWYRHVDTSNDKACAEAIAKMDEIDIKLKKIQQSYHARFIKLLPAGKVMLIIKAEDEFHRKAFRSVMKKQRMPQPPEMHP